MSEALRAKASEVVSAIRSVNRSRNQQVMVDGDDQPCYWQRKEWIDWMLDLAKELELEVAASAARDENECCCGETEQAWRPCPKHGNTK